jgi:BirA family biotin operon repressor/biotin-[acetyl-CoA-carboxylase] ligase
MEVQEEQTQEEMILSFLAEGGDEYTSGAALSDKLGLSRTAVWKHVEQLRKLGYVIEAIPSRGYRLTEVPDRLTSLELDPLLSTRDIGITLHSFERVESTNATAFKLATEGAVHGEVVVAEEQTAGKGRRGRSWSSPKGKNLYCSVILRPELPPSRASELTLVAAVALAETLRDAGVKAEIKWPNDVQVEGKKIAGILTELSADTEKVHFVIVGLGVNLNCDAADLAAEVQQTATSLKMARGQRVMRALFTAALWVRLESWLDRHAAAGFGPVREAWRDFSSTLGQEVLVKSEARELRGIAEDIDESGALLIRKSDGTLARVLAGDVEQVRSKKT